MTDHDLLFKELLATFFIEFIELFFSDVMSYLEPNSVTFLDKEMFTDVTAGERYEMVLRFNYQVVQLNQLHWRDFLNQRNPIAAALMAKMQIAPEDRPQVKAECLRLLVTLKLEPAKMQLISGFIDTYLNLNPSEEQAFRNEIDTIESEEREQVMQIVTSWMRTGIQQGQASIVIRLLKHKFGELSPDLQAQIQQLSSPQLEDLSEALLDFEQLEDLTAWLRAT